jgi:uncharacterized protein YfcZ (UPF0381/DUF406 family)
MKRYYFDVCDGDGLTRDEEGLEFSDVESAQEEAAKALADMAKETGRRAARNPSERRMSIEVRDENGPVLEARFTFEIGKKK